MTEIFYPEFTQLSTESNPANLEELDRAVGRRIDHLGTSLRNRALRELQLDLACTKDITLEPGQGDDDLAHLVSSYLTDICQGVGKDALPNTVLVDATDGSVTIDREPFDIEVDMAEAGSDEQDIRVVQLRFVSQMATLPTPIIDDAIARILEICRSLVGQLTPQSACTISSTREIEKIVGRLKDKIRNHDRRVVLEYEIL